MPRLEGFKMWEMKVAGKTVEDTKTFTQNSIRRLVFGDTVSLRAFLRGLRQEATAHDRYEARQAVSDMCAWATLHAYGLGNPRIWSDIHEGRIENRGTCITAVAALCEAIVNNVFPEVTEMNIERARKALLDLEAARTGGPSCGIYRFADSVTAEDEAWEYEDLDE